MPGKKKINRVSLAGQPPFPVIPQVWAMLHPVQYTCDLCQKVISEDRYDHHDGLCPECEAQYG
jgi:hypothetical protein